MIIWRITGQAANGSNGGPTEILAITADATTVPDPVEALREAAPNYGWYTIASIEQVAELPWAWDAASGGWSDLTRFIHSTLDVTDYRPARRPGPRAAAASN